MSETLDEILSEIEFSESTSSRDGRPKSDPTIGFKIEKSVKDKYKEIQDMTDRRFSETLKRVVIASIERTYSRLTKPPLDQ